MKHLTLAALLALAATPAFAVVETSVTLSLGGTAEKRTVIYDCESHALTVTYLHAQPNFLAVVPITDDETGLTDDMVFVNVLSASGAKYEAGKFVWWNKGTDATLHDTTEGLDAAPLLQCAERIETP
ncbi:MAG: MliC family protein [Devosia sp.]